VSLKHTLDQERFMQIAASDARHLLARGGARSGKTVVICEIVDIRALAANESRHAVLRYRANALNSLIGPTGTFFWVLQQAFEPEIWARSRMYESDGILILPNKSEVWFGGLDDPKRVDKILGTEFASMYFNESSQMPYGSVTTALTRLSQVVKVEATGQQLRQKAYFDANPPPESHWLKRLFEDKRDPLSMRPVANPSAYHSMLMNPEGNRDNLDPAYLESLRNLPERQRKRFYLGLYGDAGEAALWTSETIDSMRILNASADALPKWVRIVVSVDPSGADNVEDATSDEIGIVVAALGQNGVAYVLEDLTIKGSPAQWGAVAAHAYHRHMANTVVGEANFGGAMVRHVVHTAVDDEGQAIGATIPYKEVVASKGKHIRAEPISALTEAGKVKLLGRFQQLEDEMVGMTTAGYTGSKSPNRLDAFVWAITELFPKIVQQQRNEQNTMSGGIVVRGNSGGDGPRVILGHANMKARRAGRR
jgi:phage terminase large subunit-like protein